MVQTANKLNKKQKKTIKKYLDSLKNKIDLDQVLLFGSYAYGRPTKHSDIDLIILSNNFDHLNFFDRLLFLSKMRMGVAEDIALDVIGYTPAEFMDAEKESTILQKAKKDGIGLLKDK